MDLVIERLQATDEKDLFEFELKNRFFFEEMVPTRGDEYYKSEVFKERHKSLLEEQVNGDSYFYLIKDENGSILGRMNLIDIDKSHKTSHLGYRVGKAHAGKGIATKALKLFVEAVTSEGMKEIQAKTTTHNIASQKVLEKNGFKKTVTSHDEFEMNGQKLSFIYYTLTITNEQD